MRHTFLFILVCWFTNLFAQKDTSLNIPRDQMFCNFYLERKPEFIGGDAALFKFLRDNLHASPDTMDYAMVLIYFTVDTSGDLTDINYRRRSGSILFDQECLRVVKLMSKGKWLPGTVQGKKVSTKFFLPFRVCFE